VQVGYYQFLRWAVNHSADLPRIFATATAVYEAVGVHDKWAALKSLGDQLLDLLADFPVGLVQGFASCSPVEAQAVHASGLDLDKLRQLYELLAPLIPVLLNLAAAR